VSYGQTCNIFDPTNPPSNLSSGIMTGVASQLFTDPYGASSGTTYFTNPCTNTGGYLSHAFLTCNIPATTSCYDAPTVGQENAYAGGVHRFCNGLTIGPGNSGTKVNLVPSGGIAITPGAGGWPQGNSNYTSKPNVTITGGSGSGATANAVMTANGKNVLFITVTNPGSGYTFNSPPTVTISGGGGSGATANAVVSNGVYWITDGDLTIDSGGTLKCTICNATTGAGVTIIFTTTSGGTIGAPTMQSNATIDNLNAPGSGTYTGLLMVQDTISGATYTTLAQFQGTPGVRFNGLIYTPNSNLTFQGNPSVTNSCLLVVANTMTLQGASSLATGGCPATFPLPEVKNVALAS